TSTRSTGTSGSGELPPAPSALVQVAPKSVVVKIWPIPVMEVKPEMLRYALLALFGSGAMPVAWVDALSKGRLPVTSFHVAPLLRSACVVLKSLKGVVSLCFESAHAILWSEGANSRSWSAQAPLAHPPVRFCGLCRVTVTLPAPKLRTSTKWPPRSTRCATAGSPASGGEKENPRGGEKKKLTQGEPPSFDSPDRTILPGPPPLQGWSGDWR